MRNAGAWSRVERRARPVRASTIAARRPAADPRPRACGRRRRGRDQFIQLTEGVIAAEELERPPAQPSAQALRRHARAGGADARCSDRRCEAPRRREPCAGSAPSWAAGAGRALHRPRRAARRAASTRPAARCGSAPTAATPGPTARPTCSTWAASRRATTRPCRGCSPAAATRSGSRPAATAREFDLGRPRSRVSRPGGRRAAPAARAHRPDARPRACAASCA